MRWYLVTLLVIAFLVGTLFQATEQTGMRIWNMFATMGIFLFGVVGTLALTRVQLRAGLNGVQQALKSLEPEWVITDWSNDPGDRPDYLLVGPTGVTAVCLDHTPGSAFSWWARRLVNRSRRRAVRATDWTASRLSQAPMAMGLPVRSIVLLSRRRALPEYSADGVAVLNPDQLAAHLLAEGDPAPVDQALRFRLTRLFREQGLARTG